LIDYIRIFVRYARKIKVQEGNAAALAVVALSKAFPCEANGTRK